MSFTINFYFHLHEHNNTTIITSPINIDEIIKKVGSEEFIFLVITVIKNKIVNKGVSLSSLN